ncbi:MAG: type II toxin-antitoxin system HicB family antitoxin [Hyphomicrobium sp.]
MTRKLTYAVVIIPDDGGFRVRVPALPEVNTQGKTREQAMERVVEAIELAIEQRMADGETVPVGNDELGTVTVEAAE